MNLQKILYKLVCVGDEPGFTIGNEYEFEWVSVSFNKYLIRIKNDLGVEITHKLNEFIITMLPPSDIWVEYIGETKDGLTNGKYYNLLDRGKASISDEHYYFLDDDNKFIGAWRGRRFCDVSKIKLRSDRLKEIGI